MITKVTAAGSGFDFEAAAELHASVPKEAPTADASAFYQHCIEAAIFAHRPIWARTIPYGRKSFVQKLGSDEAQCFEAAGLMQSIPCDAVVKWWDRVAGRTRLDGDQEKLARAREAEKLSLEYEAQRLKGLGIDATPVWMAIEDNWAGYDILSYDAGASGPVSRVLEVKSTTASPLRFFVTRNEWQKCQQMGTAYHFHIWDMKTCNLFEKTGADVKPHIPADSGSGRWTNVEIPVGV